MTPPPVNILWTSGWDSTFRVLDVLLNQKRSVQPHYIVDPGRPSAQKELETIHALTDAIGPRLGDGGALLALESASIPDIDPDDAISQAWSRLAARDPLGEQYEWIARYAAMRNLTDLELSVHVDDRAYVFLADLIRSIDDSGFPNHALEGVDDPDLLLVFGRLRFPILDASKLEMQRRADDAGFRDLMEITWFCHTPRRGAPCGTCMPCKFAMEEGMSRRLPRVARWKCRLWWSGPGQAARSLARKTLRRG